MEKIGRIARLLFLFTMLSGVAFGQNRLEDLNIVLKNNFEDNTVGDYLRSEWDRDWDSPDWNCRQGELDIAQNSNDQINPSKTIQIHFPANSLGANEGGTQWWNTFDKMNEIYVSYDLMFMPGFQYQLGGKLPSVQGGEITAGVKPNGYDGFTGGLMFRENGVIAFYIYFPDSKESPYGDSFDWGQTYSSKTPYSPSSVVMEYGSGIPKYNTGEWHNITYRMVLNTVKSGGGGNFDGILEAYFDGKLVSQISHLLFRHTTDLGIDLMRMYTFFGGSTDAWRNPIAEWLKIDNVLLYTYKDGVDVPRGNTLSPTNRTITYWRKFGSTVTDPDPVIPVIPANNTPVISNQQFTVQESAFANKFIGKVTASDPDAGQTLRYSIISGNESAKFVFNSQSGEITTATDNIFVPGTTTNELMVQVTDNATEPKSATAKVTINLVGNPVAPSVNNPPTINNQEFTIKQSSFLNNLVGKVIANDIDLGQTIAYTIISGNESALFDLNSQTGNLSTRTDDIFAAGPKTYALQVKVTDNGQETKSSSATVKVNIIGTSKTVYIDPTNSQDVLKNGSIEHPFDSWRDIVWQEGYTYLQNRGTTALVEKVLISANNVSLGAYGEGELPVITSETNTYLISGYERQKVKIQNLRLQADNAVSCVYFMGTTCDSITIDHCVLTGMINGVRMVDGKTFITKYNIITSEQEGINTSSHTNEIYYNIFRNCNTAVNVTSNQSKAHIFNNVFVDNNEALSLSYADLTLYNNIFYMSSPGQKALSQGSGKIVSDNNIFFPEQNGFIKVANKTYNNLLQLKQALKIDMSSFSEDPQFVDIYNNNFALVEGSPAINAGKDLNLIEDLKGVNVPIAGNIDIGVYEYTAALFDNGAESEKSEMTLYPNPSTGQFKILAEFNEEQTDDNLSFNWSELKILDVSGKIIFSKPVEKTGSIIQENIDLSDISDGIYFIVLQFADKLIKEKLIISK